MQPRYDQAELPIQGAEPHEIETPIAGLVARWLLVATQTACVRLFQVAHELCSIQSDLGDASSKKKRAAWGDQTAPDSCNGQQKP
jgi:hypothetical protein